MPGASNTGVTAPSWGQRGGRVTVAGVVWSRSRYASGVALGFSGYGVHEYRSQRSPISITRPSGRMGPLPAWWPINRGRSFMRDMLFWAVILAVQYVLYVRVARPWMMRQLASLAELARLFEDLSTMIH